MVGTIISRYCIPALLFACLVIDRVVVVASCPNKCSGNGICFGLFCECFHGFTGGDCSERLCPASEAWTDIATNVDVAHTLKVRFFLSNASVLSFRPLQTIVRKPPTIVRSAQIWDFVIDCRGDVHVVMVLQESHALDSHVQEQAESATGTDVAFRSVSLPKRRTFRTTYGTQNVLWAASATKDGRDTIVAYEVVQLGTIH